MASPTHGHSTAIHSPLATPSVAVATPHLNDRAARMLHSSRVVRRARATAWDARAEESSLVSYEEWGGAADTQVCCC